MVSEEMRIQPLGADNYGTWSLRIRVMLQKRKLWESVEPGYLDDIEDWTNNQRNRNVEALAFIIEHVDDQYLTELETCTQAREAWEVLKAIHCNFSWLHLVTLIEELATMNKAVDVLSFAKVLQQIERRHFRSTYDCSRKL